MRSTATLRIALTLVAVWSAIAFCDERPNILFAIADDWGWPHASAYGDPVVMTPAFDRIASEGVLFQNAFVSSPSCTPSRNAILTGQYHWRLGTGANLWSTLDTKHATYPMLLQSAGYHVGHWRKSWGPGRLNNWEAHPVGKKYDGLESFLKDRSDNSENSDKKPFCFWLGASDPHRGYKSGSGKASGMDLSKIKLFEHFPDCEEIRSDVADYYFEVQRFDRDVANALELLESEGLLDNTLVVVTGDHGMPFPRCKSNVYDSGSRVPLAIRWPTNWNAQSKSGRVINDFVSLIDLAPTFLQLAGVAIPEPVTGRSLIPILKSQESGQVDPQRDRVFFGKERHTMGQEAPDRGGTPMRAVRTDDFLLIRNFRPDRWPAGTPDWQKSLSPGAWLSDCDNGPTKAYIVANRDKDAEHQKFYDLSFAKRPEFELYDLKADPGQLENVAAQSKYATKLADLKKVLMDKLKETNDPRAAGNGDTVFDPPEYFGSGAKHPSWKKQRKKNGGKKGK